MEEIVDGISISPTLLTLIIGGLVAILKGKEIWLFFIELIKGKREQNKEVQDLTEKHLTDKIAELEAEKALLESDLASEMSDKASIEKECVELRIKIAVLREKLANYMHHSRGRFLKDNGKV